MQEVEKFLKGSEYQFPLYFKNIYPAGKQMVKVESITVQIYLLSQKSQDPGGFLSYKYGLEKTALTPNDWWIILKWWSSGSEQEYLDLLADVTAFFSRIDSKMKQAKS